LGERCVVAQRRMGQLPDSLAADADDHLSVHQMDCADLTSVLDVGKHQEITGIVHLAAGSVGSGSSG